MSEDEFYQRAEAVKLDTLSDVNDIGKPWRYEEDGLTVIRTSPWSPPGCHPVGCGLKLYVDDGGRLVRVEGDENNPVTQVACALGALRSKTTSTTRHAFCIP